jgi:hypothetical protein
MGGEIGHAVFELGEKAISSLVKGSEKSVAHANTQMGGKLGSTYVQEASTTFDKIGKNANQWLSGAFSLNSQIPKGHGGTVLKDALNDYARTTDHHQALIAAENKAKGITMSKGEIYNLATKGHANSPDRNLQQGSRNLVFGKNDQILSGSLHLITKEHGSEKAKNISDGLGVFFHEEAKPYGISGVNGTRLVKNLSSDLLTKNVLGKDAAGRAIPWGQSPYKERGAIEKKLTSYGGAAMAYKAGIAHLTTPLNLLLNSSLSSSFKAFNHMFGSSYEGARTQLQLLGALGEITSMEQDQLYKFEHGLIHKFQPGSFGEFVHNNFQIPFFNAIRIRTLTAAAMQGKYIAEEHAANLMSQDISKVARAKLELKWLGINPRDVESRGGKLIDEEIRNAMYENANQRVFIDSGLHRARFATQSFVGRMVGMYHNYGAHQGNLILRTFQRHYAKGDAIGMMKDIAILGTVFPAAGAAVKSLESVWNGKNPKDVKKELEATFDPKDFWSKVEAFSHTAGFGIMTNYTRSVSRMKLANAMLGPLGNIGVELAQDTYKAGAGLASGKDRGKGPDKVKTWEPLARDVLHDIPSLGIGGIIAAHALPTQQTLNQRRPLTSKRLAAQQAAARRKAKK